MGQTLCKRPDCDEPATTTGYDPEGTLATEGTRAGQRYSWFCHKHGTEADAARPKGLTIWKRGYSPFMLGGEVNRPIKTTVDVVGDPIKVGKGFEVYEVKSPDGRTFIAEATSGGIVGDALEQVMEDIEAGDPEFMRKQVKEAFLERERARPVTVEEFFR